METEIVIEAVRNRKNQKLFIVIDDTLETRYKLINPFGETIILPDLLFEEDPIPVPASKFSDSFTPEQLESYSKHQEKMAAQARAEAERPAPPPQRQRVEAAEPARKKPSAKRVTKTPSRSGLGASWSSPRLTFYRHKIDPLQDRQTFRITVEGGDTYEISKEEFLANFNDVAMSMTWRTEGLYTYPQIPEKVKKYLRTVAK